MSLQYISDVTGIRTAVVIPIEDWDMLKQKYPEINVDEGELPQWQKDILDSRRLLVNEPGQLMSMEDFLKELEEGDNEEI